MAAHETAMEPYLDRKLELYKDAGSAALIDGARTISYAELNEVTRRFACMLVRSGLGNGDRVVVLMPKSIEPIVGILGILRIGACYIPLDESIPEKRLEFILQEVNPDAIIVTEGVSGRYPDLERHGQIFVLDDYRSLSIGDHRPDAEDEARLDAVQQRRSTDDLMYIIFTSGTTGNPKGVMIRHDGVLNYITQIIALGGYDRNSRFLCVTPLHFDAHVIGLYAMLSVGGSLAIKNKILFPSSLVKSLKDGITDTVLVSSVLRLLVSGYANLKAGSLPSLKTVMYGAESCSVEVLRELKKKVPQVSFIHGYGPTEATCGVIYHRFDEIPANADGYMPLGKPLEKVEVYAVHPDGRLIFPGEEGELYIGGIQVMAGYYNDPDRTAHVLVSKKQLSDSHLYRTGDVVSVDHEGLYRFIGRKDDMVKIGGNLVHLSEIEQCVLKLVSIHEVFVFVKKDEILNNKLACFIVAGNDNALSEEQVREHVRRFLPGYMIPEELYFINIEDVPRTTSGKVDKAALITSLT
jgi:amino acid adenylation domain-containing protein